ncbi:MAG: DNA-processing protein DprA [Corynebacterium sp.]|nr:DNA-processing protein DprA [Corynebacterium sp.]
MHPTFDNPRHAWAYLSRVVEGPHPAMGVLLDMRDPCEIAHAIYYREAWIGDTLLRATDSRHDVYRPQEDLDEAEKIGARLVTPLDEEWPRERFERAFSFARNPNNAYARPSSSDAFAPHALWVKGGNLNTLVSQSVAVVGTRAISQFGVQAVNALVPGLVNHNWTIVSGGALGVDTAAHRTALEHGGNTVAVMSCGLDRHYPAANWVLFEKISEHGCLVSEYPPGTTPARHRFLTRNRLVAALSDGVVVVEAAYRSGALSTLAWGNTLGCVGMAAPGPLGNQAFLGAHVKIQSGDAQLVTSAEDIRQLVGNALLDESGKQESLFGPSAVQQLSRNELRVYDALSNVALDTKSLSQEAGLSMGLTVSILVDLHERGYVMRSSGGWLRNGGCGIA